MIYCDIACARFAGCFTLSISIEFSVCQHQADHLHQCDGRTSEIYHGTPLHLK